MNVKKKYQFLIFILTIFFVYSFAFYTGVKRTFPYSIFSNINQDIKKILNKRKINISKTDKADCSVNEMFLCFKLPQEIIFSNSSDLNNFILDWQQVEVTNLKKLAYLKFDNDRLFYLNQDDEKFLSKINLGEKNFDEVKHGGIKKIFKMNNKYYAYVGYRKEN